MRSGFFASERGVVAGISAASSRRLVLRRRYSRVALPWGRTTTNSRDILSRPSIAFAVFWLPIIVLVVTGAFRLGGGWRTATWTAALGVLGVACIANAVRCGRIHCYLTGPFFLAMALAALLYGLGIVSLGRNGWNLLSRIVLVGGLALCCLPEWFLGKYWRRRARKVS